MITDVIVPYSVRKNTNPSLHTLTNMSAAMFAEAFKLPRWQRLLAQTLRRAAHQAAQHTLEFDRLAAQHQNLQAPSQYIVDILCSQLTVQGMEHIPTEGAVLVTCNHPGVMDAMALFASLPRMDVKAIARTRHLLDLLPNISRHLIFVPEEAHGRTSTIRHALDWLQQGKLLVTFPKGAIEPDPLLHLHHALESIEAWSPSLNLLARRIPNLTMIPAAVGGVISTQARESWIGRRYRTPSQRDWVAATLQFMQPSRYPVQPVVLIGEPLIASADRDPLAKVQTATQQLYVQLSAMQTRLSSAHPEPTSKPVWR